MELSKWQASSDIAALLGEVKREIDISRRRRVFCNRNLRMGPIELIGFDMDYTLAVYRQERMEALSVELTIKKLIENLGYPEQIRLLEYDSTWAIPGLVVDRELGNVLKMDRHGHVGRVYHGRRVLSKEERHQQYRNTRIRLALPRYTWIDTLFALPEAVEALRALRKSGSLSAGVEVKISACDPLNLAGIVLPGPRIPAVPTNHLILRDGVVVRTVIGRQAEGRLVSRECIGAGVVRTFS